MNLLRGGCLLTIASLLVALSACGAEPAKSKAPLALQVQVNVPASWRPWLDDEVADSFTDRARDILRQRGVEGRIERLELSDSPVAEVPLLTINLVDWRVNHVGNIDCTFTASLQTPRGVRQFGLYTNTTMRWLTGPGRFGLSRSFEEAAEGAIRDLCNDIAKTENAARPEGPLNE